VKKLILAVALVSIGSGAFCQTVGLKGGFNIAHQAWKYQGTKIKSDSRTGALVGVSINMDQTEKLSAQLELSYSQMGFGKTQIGSEEIPEGDFKYAKMGCAIKYHPARSANIHIGAELGLQLQEDRDRKFLTNPDLGLFFGAEYYFSPYVGIGSRYYLGLSNVNIEDPNSSGDTLEQLNRAIQIYMAFRFPSKQLKEMGY